MIIQLNFIEKTHGTLSIIKDFFINFKDKIFQNVINSYYNKTKKYLTNEQIKKLIEISPATLLEISYERLGGTTKKLYK